jgi:intracellular septation protein
MARNKIMSGGQKLLEDFGPLLVFFVLNGFGARWFGQPETQSLFIATAGFMIALTVAIAVGWLQGRRPAPVTLISAAFVFVFGGLTLYLHDETFIKIKPTIVYTLFGTVLTIGLMRGVSYLQRLMGNMLPLNQAGWLVLTRRWAVFFFCLAVLNEIAWRNLTTDQWVQLKVFGFLALTFGFAMAQMPLLSQYQSKAD